MSRCAKSLRSGAGIVISGCTGLLSRIWERRVFGSTWWNGLKSTTLRVNRLRCSIELGRHKGGLKSDHFTFSAAWNHWKHMSSMLKQALFGGFKPWSMAVRRSQTAPWHRSRSRLIHSGRCAREQQEAALVPVLGAPPRELVDERFQLVQEFLQGPAGYHNELLI